VKVHDDTHRALKELKARRRSRSIDQVIREMIRDSTGELVEKEGKQSEASLLTSYLGK
jgi:predicted CopG family antitoxin